jgi:nucleotide-binding universal stress UspA family protein
MALSSPSAAIKLTVLIQRKDALSSRARVGIDKPRVGGSQQQPDEREVGMFKVIIWATDGSSGAEQALQFAKGLAQADGARLVVVHVKEIMAGRGGGYPVKVDEDEVQAAIRKQVEDLKQKGLQAKLQLADVMAGGAAHVIAEIANEEGADLIVAGTRGHGPLSGLMLGSVTQRLLHIVHCPVLVVPPKSAGASTS